MTVRTWLAARRRALTRRALAAAVLLGVGLGLAGLAVGLVLGRLGAYRTAPWLVLVGWVLAALGLAAGGWRARVLAARLAPARVARAVEGAGGLRAGRVAAFATGRLHGSTALAAAADRSVARWLDQHGQAAAAPLARRLRRDLARSAVVLGAGVGAFALGGPAGSDGRSALWHPLATMRRGRAPVTLAADRPEVRRGQTVTLAVEGAGRRRATLSMRGPGEPWHDTTVALDTAGRALVTLGPLADDRFVRALTGRRTSDSVHIRVTVPAFLADLRVTADYPAYLGLPDEPFLPGPDAVPLPEGTRLRLVAEATVPLAGAALVDADGRRVPLRVDGRTLRGILTVTRDARWLLTPAAADGAPFDPPLPTLAVLAVADSAPAIALPVPGADTTAPLSLRQPLVVDVRDDYRVAHVEVVSSRHSRLGLVSAPVVDTVPLPPEGLERAILQWTLDFSARGLLPGDTLVYRARARDNAPVPQEAATREFRLRLPALDELRARAREEASALAAEAGSLVRDQQAVGRATEDLAAQRARTERADGTPDDQLGFERAERAGELTRQQEELLDRAEALRDRLHELQEAAREAGVHDPAWQAQMAELERLLAQAITPELREALEALREAMERLDAPAMQEALQRMAEAQRQLRDELERSRELFERAALEGQLSTLAEDAEQLAADQDRWTDQAGRRADSATAAAEDRLRAEAERLADALAEAGLEAQAAQAAQATDAMQQAAEAARAGDQRQAAQAGGEASEALGQIPPDLRRQRDALRAQWRREVLDQLDRAMVEVADLARRQEAVTDRIARGEAGADTRAAQAAVRDGVDRVVERLQHAAGMNALVSPRLTAALGFARLAMTRGVEALQQANPNVRVAGGHAGQALDGLNTVAHQLLRSRSDVQGAQSGSGLQEALEQLSQMAQQQNAMAGQASGLLPLMPGADQVVMQELRRLAAQQRQLAQDLERMRADQGREGLDALAEEARELARQLEGGALDRRTIERQERLYRRLLDQGRTLRGEETDDQRERQSRTAETAQPFVPPGARPPDRGPRFPYPSWEALQQLSPETRRAVLEYFRRLNEGS